MGLSYSSCFVQETLLLGGDQALQACSLHYPQSIEARLTSTKRKRCDRRVRASFRRSPSDWPGHREAKSE